jgi:hypothetical protein
METATGSEGGDVGVKALASNKENVPEAVANRRSSLAPWGTVGATPSKLQDLAKRCVSDSGVARLGAARAGHKGVPLQREAPLRWSSTRASRPPRPPVRPRRLT